MVAVAPFSSPVADISVGVLCAFTGTILLIRYLLYLYCMMMFSRRGIEFNCTQYKEGSYFSNNKKVHPTILSAFYSDKDDDISRRSYLLMKARLSQGREIEMIDMGRFYVIQKGAFKVQPVFHVLLVFFISAFAFYRFYD